MRPPSNKPPAGRHLWEIAAARDILTIIGAALALWLLYLLRGLVFPILIALLLAHLVNPLVTFLEFRWRWPRPVTISLILAAVILASVGFILWLGPILSEQVLGLLRNLPDYIRTLSSKYGLQLGSFLEQLEYSLRQAQTPPQQVLSSVFKTTGQAIGIVAKAFSTAGYVVIALILVVMFFFQAAWRFNTAIERLKSYLPRSRKERILGIADQMDKAIAAFFRGRLVIATIIGVLLSVGWFLTGVPYWFFLGMLTGLLNIVPYLSVLTWPIAILLKYVETINSPEAASAGFASVALWPSVVYFGVQLLDNWILTPWIQSGGDIKMNPATVLVVVLIGGTLAGTWGLLFAIPVAACIKIFLEEVVLPPLREWAASR